jgi:dsDNA-binding SOS-regulon protein
MLYILLRLTNVILVWWTYRRKQAMKMQCSRKQKRMVVSRHTELYNVMLEVADQCNVWMQKSVFNRSENRQLSASVVCKCLLALENIQAVL